MTAHEFVIWLRGFVQASSNYTLTPKQFDDLKEQLATVVDTTKVNKYTVDRTSYNINTTADIDNTTLYNTTENDK